MCITLKDIILKLKLKKLIKQYKKEEPIYILINSYYLNINGQGYEQVENNKEVKLENGSNTIELSLDGQNTMTSVVIEKK